MEDGVNLQQGFEPMSFEYHARKLALRTGVGVALSLGRNIVHHEIQVVTQIGDDRSLTQAAKHKLIISLTRLLRCHVPSGQHAHSLHSY